MTMAYVGRVATLLRKQLYMLHTKNENISVRKMNKIFSLKITMLNQVEYHLWAVWYDLIRIRKMLRQVRLSKGFNALAGLG